MQRVRPIRCRKLSSSMELWAEFWRNVYHIRRIKRAAAIKEFHAADFRGDISREGQIRCAFSSIIIDIVFFEKFCKYFLARLMFPFAKNLIRDQ